MALGALGVVFGDIGTSPLYAVRALFSPTGRGIALTADNVYGLISLVLWSVMIVVSVKYVLLVMRADNRGEGGIMALISLVKDSLGNRRLAWLFVSLGLVGMALFYGDSAITPAISVLSAVEGLNVVTSGLQSFIVPVTLLILAALFLLQRYGTNLIGHLFGPVMLVWFLTIGLGGAWQVLHHPGAWQVLSPVTALGFFVAQPGLAFLAMGAVVLAITGAEALYADMGHFGRSPISRAWFLVVFPALILCYTGQGALLLAQPETASNPLFYLFPAALRLPVVLLATLATLIASQSVISGAFSITRQAIHLNFLPRLTVRHTSNRTVGQIYMPFVNYTLFVLVILLVLYFGSSQRLANAYGVAVSGTLAIDTLLFLAVLRHKWHESRWVVLLAALLLLPLDILFVTSNLAKVAHGGWIPLLIALGVFTLATTWAKGQKIVIRERHAQAGTLDGLVREIRQSRTLKTFPGQAVYISHSPHFAPLALRETLEELHELPDKILIVSIEVSNHAHVPEDERAEFDNLGYEDGISHLKLTYGYHDTVNIPKALQSRRHLSPELDIDPKKAAYYISRYKVVPTKRHNMAGWRKILYSFLSRNSLSHSDYYKLPLNHTQEVSSLIKL